MFKFFDLIGDMNGRSFGFEKLEVYQEARNLVKEVYELQKRFPSEERYALGDQIRRAAVSITSNIAEGSGRTSLKEKIHFVCIAFGSMMETFSQLQIAQDLGYISEQEVESVRPLFNHVSAQLTNLKKHYESRIKGEAPSAG